MYTQTNFIFFSLPPFSFPEREEETYRRKIIGFPALDVHYNCLHAPHRNATKKYD